MTNIIKFFAISSFLFVINSCSSLMYLLGHQEVDLLDLPTAIEEARDGSTIFINSGTYEDVNLRIQSRGKKLTIRPKTLGEVKITGKVEHSVFTILNSDGMTFEGFLFEKVDRNVFGLFNSSDIKIENNYFYQCGSSPTNSLIRLRDGSSNNKISNNTFDDVWALGIVIATSNDNPRDKNNTNNEIFGNYFVNIPAVNKIYPGEDNGMECIQIGHDFEKTIDYELHTKIYNNLFENVIGDGAEIISNKSSANEIYNNTFINNRSGVTIRAGNSVTFKNNYLDNTSRGLRIYGADHKIINNYIKNASVAMSLPSADFSRGERMTRVGYYQQDEIEIENNIILNPQVCGIEIGQGNRSLSARNSRVANNRIILENGGADFNVNEERINSNLEYRQNVVYGDNRAVQSRSSVLRGENRVRSDFQEIDVEKFLGYKPFNSNDERVGTSWKRPSILRK